jgi:hypothetical protein
MPAAVATSEVRARTPAAAHALALLSIALGALAFGAVYPWACWPLAIVSLACGVVGLLATGSRRAPVPSRALLLGLSAVAIAGLLQVLPLPIPLLAELSPATGAVIRQIDPVYAAGLVDYHALSVTPARTWTALALYGSFAVLMLGMSRVLSLRGARPFAEELAVFGVLLALVAIIQEPIYEGRIYGFWQPLRGHDAFGPFVNKNHFAGWMLLALPIVLALVCAALEQAMRGLKPGWHNRVLWLSSPEASRLVLLAASAGIMTLALVLTMSRSGISALAVSLVLTGLFVVRGLTGRSRKAAGAAYLLLLTITVVGWIGADAIVTRFSKADWSEFNNRWGAWSDAWNIAETFPLAGTGLNTYETAALFYQRHGLEKYFGEAHNDYLELAAGGGLLVGVPIILCLAIFVRDVNRRMRDEPGSDAWWVRRGAVTALVAIALQEVVDFSLQMPGNAVLFSVVCAIALHADPRAPASKPPTALHRRCGSVSPGRRGPA